MRLRSQSYMQG